MRFAVALVIAVLAAPALGQETSLPDFFHPCILADDMDECQENGATNIRVIDGDTFEWNGEVIGLWGIDAPELDQTCVAENEEVAIGEDAFTFLLLFLRRGTGIFCDEQYRDRYGRPVARCEGFFANSDVGQIMVRRGLAWDYAQFSGGEYADAQDLAQTEGLGIWQEGLDCIPPWEWREGDRG